MPDTKPQTQDNAKKLHLGISFSDYRKSKTKKEYCETSQREKHLTHRGTKKKLHKTSQKSHKQEESGVKQLKS